MINSNLLPYLLEHLYGSAYKLKTLNNLIGVVASEFNLHIIFYPLEVMTPFCPTTSQED